MISSKEYNPQYTFEINDSMVTKPFEKKSFVKCQIIGGFTQRDIIRTITTMRLVPFENLILKINESIF